MNKVLVARELIRIAKNIMAEDYDYIYDPDHKQKPGGGYVKTEKGWSKGKSDKGTSGLSKSQEQAQVHNIASNPKTSDSVLNKIVQSNDWEVASMAAINPNASEDTKYTYLDNYLKAGCPQDSHGSTDAAAMEIGQAPNASSRIKKKYEEIEKYWSENPL